MLERAAAGHLCGQPLAGQNLGQFAAWFTTPTERDASAVGLLYLRVAVALALAWLACAVCAKYCVEPWLPRSSFSEATIRWLGGQRRNGTRPAPYLVRTMRLETLWLTLRTSSAGRRPRP